MTINRQNFQRRHMFANFVTKHHSNECTKVKDPSARIAIVERKKLCFNCLGSHLAKECKSQNKCRKCSKKHHISLCGDRFVAEQKSESVKTGGQNGEKAVPVVMHTSFTVKQISNVSLKTEIAPVYFTNCEGAQRSFITESLARKLNVNTTGKETV
ncbi:unnamed protein product [Mytilus coruscus]|uniref:Uncharacterized protein n=1 Tax=Mytilus coruscus TaxID=42192 RepID=A0A6J8CKH1_MYTCO|nr:unnamed protein product [Mytilus coruscus]